jgi:hypothetical protein
MKQLAHHCLRLFNRIGLTLLLMTWGTIWAQTQPILPLAPPTASTVPGNGDLDPLGAAFAPAKLAAGFVLQPHDLLISNFNNNQNLQGFGSTLVRMNTNGQISTFYQGRGIGLTGALAIARAGVVFVGNMPTFDGTAATVQAGSILVLDGNGNLLGSIANSQINGPWGMALIDHGTTGLLFVSNVLSGTIVRLDLSFPSFGTVVVTSQVVVGSGFNHRPDPAALVLGPAGMVFDPMTELLYIASSTDEAIYALKGVGSTKTSLGSGTLVYQDYVHLHGPTQMALAPNGDLLVANSDGSNVDPNQPSELVEFTTAGQFVTQFSVDPNNGGASGIVLDPIANQGLRVAAPNDNSETVTIYTKLLP